MHKDLSKVKLFHVTRKLAKILCQKTMTDDSLFFELLVSYNLAKLAAMMRCNIQTLDRGIIPVSMYAMNLAPSGHGKGYSTNIIEASVINEFRERFTEVTYPEIVDQNLNKLATVRAARKKLDPDDEFPVVQAEFVNAGVMAFSFDSGTTPALKQARHLLLMAGIGSINMEIDEIGSNLLGQQEILTAFLELFDIGKIKQKLVKNTRENIRNEEIEGGTPTNMMLFGTPAKLLNGGKQEEELDSMLVTGYARRCFFGYSTKQSNRGNISAKELYKILTNDKSNTYITNLSHQLGNLADISNYNTVLTIDKSVTLEILQYQIDCAKAGEDYEEHKEVLKAELEHRYFKALKLAGAHAFIDNSDKITSEHFWSAVKLVEASGKAFHKILDRAPPWERLAKYVAMVKRPLTYADLAEELPYYKGSEMQKKEMIKLACAWGYNNNVVITTYENDGIQFLEGDSLEETNLDKMTIAYSTDIAKGYRSQKVPFHGMDKLLLSNKHHWINHALNDPTKGQRREENCIPGFNLIVIDVDSGINMKTAELLLRGYMHVMHTTKRHTDTDNRFRIIFPMSHTLKLSAQDYRDFMTNIYDWLPFDVDRQTNQRARKWLTHSGTLRYNNKGEILDILPFIPKTRKATEQRKLLDKQGNFSNLERWFINNIREGNRSNQLIRYAYALVDNGKDINDIQVLVLAMNRKIKPSLPEQEIKDTILVSARRKIHERDTAKP